MPSLKSFDPSLITTMSGRYCAKSQRGVSSMSKVRIMRSRMVQSETSFSSPQLRTIPCPECAMGV